MITYLVRRLLLMIPTLLGISFLVFMLVALSPGGIGAALELASGQMEATSRAVQEAYLEDRYGLNDPVVVQYFRWLGQISPIKFGVRDQIAPSGERISRPRDVDPPPLWHWHIEALPEPPPNEDFSFAADATEEERARAHRRVQNQYAQRRANYVANSALLRQRLVEYLRATGHEYAVTKDSKVEYKKLRGVEPDPAVQEWQPLQEQAEKTVESYAEALVAKERLDEVFMAKPYREAGYPIIPGVLSVGAPDLGKSFSRSRPVTELIKEALPVTLLLNLIAFPIIYLIAIPSGMLAAVRRGTWVDVVQGVTVIALWSIPIVWAGVLAIGFLARPGWFPVAGIMSSDADSFTFLPTFTDEGWHRGFLLDVVWHITLPVLLIVYGAFAVLSKQTRAAMLDNFNQDYVRTAKAKGVARKDIILKHVFRNSLLPLITMFVTIFPAMLSGSVVIERIFTIPGMGNMMIEAIYLRDREIILAVTVIIAMVNLLALLLADVLYALADPRISYS